MRSIKRTYISSKETVQQYRALKIAIRLVLLFMTIALLAPVLANDRPLVCKYKQVWMFPAFSFNTHCNISAQESINYAMGKEWKLISADLILFPPCAYSPNSMDSENAPLKSPFDKQFITDKKGTVSSLPLPLRHWLGTTQNGNDVLSNIIHGTRIAMYIGIFSMLIAALLGISLGAGAGFFGNRQLKTGYITLCLNLLSVFIIWFYGFYIRGEAWTTCFNSESISLIMNILLTLTLSVFLIIAFHKLGKWLDHQTGSAQKHYIPVDAIVSRMIELLNSIPALLLIIAISALAKPSYTLLILIIGFLSWTNIARIARAEFIKAKQLDYVTSARAIGMSNLQIMHQQILPNVMPVLMVQIIFGMGGAILAEASLSFIGVGVPIDSASWGHLLNEGRDHFSAWWLVLCPGACMVMLLVSYNTIARYMDKQSALVRKKVAEPD